MQLHNYTLIVRVCWVKAYDGRTAIQGTRFYISVTFTMAGKFSYNRRPKLDRKILCQCGCKHLLNTICKFSVYAATKLIYFWLAGIDVHSRYKEETPGTYKGFRTHLDLVQSDRVITQKHQDLYVSPNGRNCKAEKLAEQQADAGETAGRTSILAEPRLQNTQSDLRDTQLGRDTASQPTSNSTCDTPPGVFKFGQAPDLNSIAAISVSTNPMTAVSTSANPTETTGNYSIART